MNILWDIGVVVLLILIFIWKKISDGDLEFSKKIQFPLFIVVSVSIIFLALLLFNSALDARAEKVREEVYYEAYDEGYEIGYAEGYVDGFEDADE